MTNALQLLEEQAAIQPMSTPRVSPLVDAALAGGRRRLRRQRAAYATPAIAATGFAAVAVSSVHIGPVLNRPASLATASPQAPANDPVADGVEVTVLPAGYSLASTKQAAPLDPASRCFTQAGLHFLQAGESQADGPGGWARDIEVSVDRGPYDSGTLPVLTDPVGQVVESPYSGPGTRHGVFRDLRVNLAPQLWATVRVADLPAATLRSVVDGLQLGGTAATSAPGC